MIMHRSTHVSKKRRWRPVSKRCASFFIGCFVASAIGASAQDFETQRKAVAASIEAQSEETVIKLLKTGIAEAKPTQASSLAGKWLRQNLPEKVDLFYYAGRSAELSGDWAGAAALYQQYLVSRQNQIPPASLIVYYS